MSGPLSEGLNSLARRIAGDDDGEAYSCTLVTQPMTQFFDRISRWPARKVGAAVVLLVMALLFVLGPYQHGDQGLETTRMSVVAGLLHVVAYDSEWLYCPIVPVVAAFLVYLRRRELAVLPLQGRLVTGLGILLLGLGVYWVGYKADTIYPGFLSVHLVLAGIIVLLAGWRWMAALAFPWAFLVFTWPTIPLEDWVAFPLRMMTADLSSQLLHLLGIDVVREGTGLYSAPDAARGLVAGKLFKLDVEVPCSGIRSLSALMMISALYGYLSLKRWLPRLFLFLSAVPLAVAGNIVRMALLALGSIWLGTDVAVGRVVGGTQEISFYHEMAGYSVFAVALAGMFAFSTLLEGRHWKRLASMTKQGASCPAESSQTGPDRKVLRRSGLAVVLALAALWLCARTGQQPPISPSGVVMQLPLSLGSLQGINQEATAQETNGLTEGVKIERKLYISNNRQMLATIVLSGPVRRALHRPDICLPGQGWSIAGKMEVPVRLSDGREITVMMMRLFRDSLNESGHLVRLRGLNLFWYQGYGEVQTADYYDHVFLTYFDSVFKNLNHRWALMSFFMPYSESELGTSDPVAEAGAMEALRDMIGQVAPMVLKKTGQR